VDQRVDSGVSVTQSAIIGERGACSHFKSLETNLRSAPQRHSGGLPLDVPSAAFDYAIPPDGWRRGWDCGALHHQAGCGYAEEIKSLQRQGVDYALLCPCGLRWAANIKFCVSQNSAFKPCCLRQGVLGPTLKRSHPSPDERDWGESGGGGIRTHGTFRLSSFQDRRNKL
jgi:hypothetical protein